MVIDPNWVGAIGQWAGAIGTTGAVAVALYQASDAKKSTRQARYDGARPILMIGTRPQTAMAEKDYPLAIQPDNPTWLQWNAREQSLDIQNIGTGVALNIVSVLYGPEALVLPGNTQKRDNMARNEHWTAWDCNPISPGQHEIVPYTIGASMFIEGNKRIQNCSFNASPHPFFNPIDPEPTYLCRVTTTYHDVFGRKHASIFDVDSQYRWRMVACLENIKIDLFDLEGLQPKKKLKRG